MRGHRSIPGPLAPAVLALVLAVLVAGCIGVGDDEASDGGDAVSQAAPDPAPAPEDGDASDGNTAGSAGATGQDLAPNDTNRTPTTLPSNVTLENATLVEQTNSSVTFVRRGTIPREPVVSELPDGDTVADPQISTLEVPPDRWLKLEITVTWNRSSDHVVPEVRHEGVEWCRNFGFADPAEGAERTSSTTEATCTVRPEPRSDWERWSIRPRYDDDFNQFSLRETGYGLTVEVTAQRGPWSDVESSDPGGGWSPIEEAAIRPGAKMGPSGCTANFVFRSPDNASLYVGTANHCFADNGVGTTLPVAGIPDAGRIAYCSWGAMPEHSSLGCSFPLEDDWRRYHNDFMLVEIRPDLRHQVHPAVRHWGGPTGLAGNLSDGDRVLAYGNSALRDASSGTVPGPGDPMRGHVTGQTDRWVTFADLAPGGIPGDSGGPALDGSGRAIGHFQDITCPFARNADGTSPGSHGAATNSFATLAPALEALHSRTDLDAQLVTWPLVQEPAFPPSPSDPGPEPAGCAGG